MFHFEGFKDGNRLSCQDLIANRDGKINDHALNRRQYGFRTRRPLDHGLRRWRCYRRWCSAVRPLNIEHRQWVVRIHVRTRLTDISFRGEETGRFLITVDGQQVTDLFFHVTGMNQITIERRFLQ